jgi:U3 small nucleolar RNA-associated protein 25
MDEVNSTTTRLLTLLNVSAVKTGKRKRGFGDSIPVQKLNKRKSVLFADVSNDEQKSVAPNVTAGAEDTIDNAETQVEQKDSMEDNESQCVDGFSSRPLRYR